MNQKDLAVLEKLTEKFTRDLQPRVLYYMRLAYKLGFERADEFRQMFKESLSE